MRRLNPLLTAAFLAAILALPHLASADAAKKYQVTGVVTELTADKVVLTKPDGEKWELKRDAADADQLAVGAKVTIYYTMVVGRVEAKATTKPAK